MTSPENRNAFIKGQFLNFKPGDMIDVAEHDWNFPQNYI